MTAPGHVLDVGSSVVVSATLGRERHAAGDDGWWWDAAN
jgi:hypothetical protein